MKTRWTGLVVASLAVVLALCPAATAGRFDIEIKLTASDAAAKDFFGCSVAISGRTAIVGADGNDDAGDHSGSAYLFDVPTGEELAKLTASDGAPVDVFAYCVAISGETAIVGAHQDDDASDCSGSAYLFDVATGTQLAKLTASDAGAADFFGLSVAVSAHTAIVGAKYDDDAGSYSGSAYLFDVATGEQLAKLTASDAAAGDYFGYSVAIRGETAIIGAAGNDDAGSASGSAYLFDAATGEERFKLTASDAAAGDWFGCSVGISGEMAVVGAYGNDDAGDWSGSAYLFDVATGEELAKLTASDGAAFDYFGCSVGVSGETAIVGADANDDAGSGSGSAYLFDVATAEELGKLTASDAMTEDCFGWSVGISGERAIVGAHYDDDAGSQSGSAYIFVPEPVSLSLMGAGLIGIALRKRMKRTA